MHRNLIICVISSVGKVMQKTSDLKRVWRDHQHRKDASHRAGDGSVCTAAPPSRRRHPRELMLGNPSDVGVTRIVSQALIVPITESERRVLKWAV